ncbi:MAG: hypothetical protein G01um101472_145 [Parcubacteria group bacterium Gr01-1014_72]|nr:MAG: hypothetical protein G01um101472_145 [Parcubacteria group bacterium Gr01-1014_72]
MTVAEKNIRLLFQEVHELKGRVSGLVPLDQEGQYRKSFLRKLDRIRISKARFTFKSGILSRLK